MNILKHAGFFVRELLRGNFRLTDQGLLLADRVVARGIYHPYLDGKYLGAQPNLVPLEGLQYFLETGLAGNAALTSWYLALFSGAVNPVSTWTAANFTANASEIVSATEGYSNATRPQWTPGAISGSKLGNLASLATYNIVCTTSINISGAALLSNSTKGGTTGILASATRFDQVHTVNNGSTFEVGYEVELTDS